MKQYPPIRNLRYLLKVERLTIADVARRFSRSHGAVVAQMVREGIRKGEK